MFLLDVLARLVVKPVLSLDHTKINNIDSIDQETGRKFYRGDKGMGPSALVATDATGRLCYLEWWIFWSMYYQSGCIYNDTIIYICGDCVYGSC